MQFNPLGWIVQHSYCIRSIGKDDEGVNTKQMKRETVCMEISSGITPSIERETMRLTILSEGNCFATSIPFSKVLKQKTSYKLQEDYLLMESNLNYQYNELSLLSSNAFYCFQGDFRILLKLNIFNNENCCCNYLRFYLLIVQGICKLIMGSYLKIVQPEIFRLLLNGNEWLMIYKVFSRII